MVSLLYHAALPRLVHNLLWPCSFSYGKQGEHEQWEMCLVVGAKTALVVSLPLSGEPHTVTKKVSHGLKPVLRNTWRRNHSVVVKVIYLIISISNIIFGKRIEMS